MGKRLGLDSKFIYHLLVTLRKLTSAYCSLLNMEIEKVNTFKALNTTIDTQEAVNKCPALLHL